MAIPNNCGHSDELMIPVWLDWITYPTLAQIVQRYRRATRPFYQELSASAKSEHPTSMDFEIRRACNHERLRFTQLGEFRDFFHSASNWTDEIITASG